MRGLSPHLIALTPPGLNIQYNYTEFFGRPSVRLGKDLYRFYARGKSGENPRGGGDDGLLAHHGDLNDK